MNTQKLAAMSDERINQACVLHAGMALTYRNTNTRLYEAHICLLDQCADILRVKRGKLPMCQGAGNKKLAAV